MQSKSLNKAESLSGQAGENIEQSGPRFIRNISFPVFLMPQKSSSLFLINSAIDNPISPLDGPLGIYFVPSHLLAVELGTAELIYLF